MNWILKAIKIFKDKNETRNFFMLKEKSKILIF